MIRAALEGVCLQMRLIVDRLDEVAPVGSLRVTGGVFRSALWREIMAAMLARPIHVVGDAEGTALGAAALGLFAIGRASSLTAAADALGRSGDAADATVPPDPRLVETYDGLRASVGPLIAELDGVAELLR
jgi:gluconokinase